MRAPSAIRQFLLIPAFLAVAAHAAQLPPDRSRQSLAFELNQGQTGAEVAYLTRGKGYLLFLKPTEALMSLKSSPKRAMMRMHLVNPSPEPRLRAARPLRGTHNYYIGNDPKHWHSGIPTYEEVISDGVYPGIDMIYHGEQGSLEYDFKVAAHGNPNLIRLTFSGQDRLATDDHGDLVLKIGHERVVHQAPVAYQELNGSKVPVKVRYVLRNGIVSFKLGRYDRGRPLIIDPTMVYASYLGGSGEDQGRAIATDAAGNIYIAGMTSSSDLPRADNSALAGGHDAFVTKLDNSGAVVFSTYLGSDGSDEPYDPNDGEPRGEKANAIALSQSGLIYVTGGTAANAANAFPTLGNAYQTCDPAAKTVFVSVLDDSDGRLQYSTCVGNANQAEGLGIAVDDVDNAYVVGWTNVICTTQAGCPFPTTPTALQGTKKTGTQLTDSFFFKLNPSGGIGGGLAYSTLLGSKLDSGATCCNTYATAVAVDGNRIAYVTGLTNDLSSGVLADAFETAVHNAGTTYRQGYDAFFYAIDAIAGSITYACYLGGDGDDIANAIALDSRGSVYLAGSTTSDDLPATTGAYRTDFGGGTGSGDAFVARFDRNGTNAYLPGYVTYLGGSGDDSASAIAVDSSTGRAYVTGYTSSFDLFDGSSASILYGSLQGSTDAFVAGIDASGKSLHSGSYLGGTESERGQAIAVSQDGSEKTYVVGYTSSSDFRGITANATQPLSAGGTDAFIAEVRNLADLGVLLTATPAPAVSGTLTYAVQVTNHGPDQANFVVLTLDVSAASSALPLADFASNSGLCTQGTNDSFRCTLGSMASGDTVALTFSGKLTASDPVIATAAVSANEVDSLSSNNSATWNTVASPPSSSGGGGGAIGIVTLILLVAARGLRPLGGVQDA